MFCSQVRCGEVARTLADLEASKECVAAALLHSVLDSSMLTELQLREVMSKEVADTVCNVHKLSNICQVCGFLMAAPLVCDPASCPVRKGHIQTLLHGKPASLGLLCFWHPVVPNRDCEHCLGYTIEEATCGSMLIC